MSFFYLLVLVTGFNLVQASVSSAESPEAATAADAVYDFPFRNRSAWGARTPKDILPLVTPVPYIVIHDTGEPPAIEVAGCLNFTQCSQSMKNIQNMHVDMNGWWDIGYNFCVGGDGAAYEGRGWDVLGAQAKYFNTISIGICFIGDYASKLPTVPQLDVLNQLIAAGVKLGYVRPDYRIVNHGQVRATVCPGKKLAKKVLTWPHYSTFPASPRDLLDIPELPDTVKEEIKKEFAAASSAAV